MNRLKLTDLLTQPPRRLALLTSLTAVACTAPNPSYEACIERPYACTDVELCDGVDGDGDGQVDEDLDEPCALFLPGYLSGPEGRFGRSLAVFDDLNMDGLGEVCVGTAAAPHGLDELPPVSPEGSVTLISGADFESPVSSESFEPIFKVSRKGTFGAQLAVGDFDGDGQNEIATSIPFGGDEGDVGVWIYEANGDPNARYLADEQLTRFGASMTVTRPQTEGVTGDVLLVSEPYWSGPEGRQSGRLVGLRAAQGRVELDHSIEGTAEDMRLGERILSAFDTDGDGQPEVMSTLWWGTGDQELIREMWLLNGVSGAREMRVATQEDTQGSFGEGLAWGYFHDDREPNFALGAPRISSDSGAERGRVYFINADGGSLGTTGVEGREYGSALLTIKRSPEEGDLILVAGRGYMRLFGANREAAREINLEHDEIPSLAASSKPGADGRYRVYVGFPKVGRVYVLGVR